MLLVVAVLLAASPAAAESVTATAPPAPAAARPGFTSSLSTGIALLTTGDSGATGFPVNIGIGAFVTPRTAVLARWDTAWASMPSVVEDDRVWIRQSFFGLTVQHWLTDRFFVGGGSGRASRDRGKSASNTGYGFELRSGYDLFYFGRRARLLAVQIGVDAIAGVYDNSSS